MAAKLTDLSNSGIVLNIIIVFRHVICYMCRYLLILFVSEGLLFIQLRMQVLNRRCFCLHPVNRLGFSFPPRADLLADY